MSEGRDTRSLAMLGTNKRSRSRDIRLRECTAATTTFLPKAKNVLVGRGGLEPPTSRLSGVRSNHLSYRPRQAGRPDS